MSFFSSQENPIGQSAGQPLIQLSISEQPQRQSLAQMSHSLNDIPSLVTNLLNEGSLNSAHIESPNSNLSPLHSSSEDELKSGNNINKENREFPTSRKRKFESASETSLSIDQYKINFICSCLYQCKIKTRQDLLNNFEEVMKKINSDLNIFRSDYTGKECYDIFKEALKNYNRVNAFKISFYESDFDFDRFKNRVSPLNSNSSPNSTPSPCCDDLSRVTKNYDRLVKSQKMKRTMNQNLTEMMRGREFITCGHIILGTGDSGVSIWLEKYKSYHGKTQEKIDQNCLPEVLMIGKESGCWIHDYTLAQPHNLLERGDIIWNPSDFVSDSYYQCNPYTNGRHVYQANQVVLAETQAPLLTANVTNIEKQCDHLVDWKCRDCDYRLIISTADGVKAIYTNEIDICTGLGPARNALSGTIISSNEFACLNQFDEKKQFTPIVDGNQFILTDTEERCKAPRTIVIYGGGGTAAACYRKGFFGHDINTEPLEFEAKYQKNNVFWIGRSFDKAGGGKLATKALETAKNRKERFAAELQQIVHNNPNGKMILVFKPIDPTEPTFEIACDQLVYSLGQEDIAMKKICNEVDQDLVLDFDDQEMPLGVKTRDDKIHFYGASAMAVREKEYSSATWKWLKKENIGPDVGPGSMPPSRAQIKRYTSKKGIPLESINVNMDSQHVISEFLVRIGIEPKKATLFIEDILEARKHSTAGFSRKTLRTLLQKHGLENVVEIRGHGHITEKVKVG